MATFEIETRVGPSTGQDGAKLGLRGDRDGALVVQLANGRYVEAVRRGAVYIASISAAGVAPGTALSTTPPFTLYNPASSGKLVVPLRTTVGFVSGTLGAGSLVYATNNNPVAAAPTGGTGLTAYNQLLGGAQNNAARAYTGATVPATPTLLRPMCSVGAFTTSTAVPPQPMIDDLDGAFAIKPGCSISVQGIAAAGTSPLVIIAMSWVEIPE
jgi:hypothetical protein